jgi:hypothetical protein
MSLVENIEKKVKKGKLPPTVAARRLIEKFRR